MADDEAAAAKAPERGGGGKKKLLLLGGLVLLLVGGAAGAYLMMAPGASGKPGGAASGDEVPEAASVSEGGEPLDEVQSSAAGEAGAGASSPQRVVEETHHFGATTTLKPFHINLGNPLENRFIRLEIALEYRQGDPQRDEIETRTPQLRDAVLSVAGRKTREFLLSPDGKDQLRLELLNRINQVMTRKIEAVYITDFLIE